MRKAETAKAGDGMSRKGEDTEELLGQRTAITPNHEENTVSLRSGVHSSPWIRKTSPDYSKSRFHSLVIQPMPVSEK